MASCARGPQSTSTQLDEQIQNAVVVIHDNHSLVGCNTIGVIQELIDDAASGDMILKRTAYAIGADTVLPLSVYVSGQEVEALAYKCQNY